MPDNPEIQIGCERNEAGEPLIRVGGMLCGTVDRFKSAIAAFEQSETRRFDVDDPAFISAVMSVVKHAQRRGIL
jgi:hypothetical protein